MDLKALSDRATLGACAKIAAVMWSLAAGSLIAASIGPLWVMWRDRGFPMAFTPDAVLQSLATIVGASLGFAIVGFQIRQTHRQSIALLDREYRLRLREKLAPVLGDLVELMDRLEKIRGDIQDYIDSKWSAHESIDRRLERFTMGAGVRDKDFESFHEVRDLIFAALNREDADRIERVFAYRSGVLWRRIDKDPRPATYAQAMRDFPGFTGITPEPHETWSQELHDLRVQYAKARAQATMDAIQKLSAQANWATNHLNKIFPPLDLPSKL